MEFDTYTIVLLVTPENPPDFTEEERDRLQDAHLAHLSKLHEQGVLLVGGPVGDPSGKRYYRGLSVFNVDPEEALRLKGEDPAIQAGVFEMIAMPWTFPAGAVHFTATDFPRSTDDV